MEIESAHLGKEMPTGTAFAPEPQVSPSVFQELASYGEKHSLDLSLSWDGWRRYWALMQRGRVWVGPGDDDLEIKDFHALDLVIEKPVGSGYYQTLDLQNGDNRLLQMLDACFMGDRRTEYEKFRETKNREREKAIYQRDIEQAQQAAEEMDSQMTTGSVEHALGKDKVYSGPGMGKKS